MATQNEIKGTPFANNLAAQLGVLMLAAVIVIALAWQYVW